MECSSDGHPCRLESSAPVPIGREKRSKNGKEGCIKMYKGNIVIHFQALTQTLLRISQPFYFGVILKIKTRFFNDEVRAIVSFDRRMWYHNLAIKGRNGFLFHRDHDAIEQLTGGIVFRDRQLDEWVVALKGRNDWCDTHNCSFRFLIVPEKHVVYTEYLPKYIRISGRRPVVQLLDALDEDLATKFIYPLKALREANAGKQTFLKTDTHWTSYGAFVGYKELLDSLAPELPLEMVQENDIIWKDRSFIGDIGVRFNPERGEIISVAEPLSNYKLIFQNRNFGRGAIHVYQNDRRDLPRCVLFRDSTSTALIPFLMRGFSRLVAISSLSCNYELLEHEKPDVVLFIVVERFMATFGIGDTIELPVDHPNAPFASLFGTDFEDIEK
jgi:hypothetical protein